MKKIKKKKMLKSATITSSCFIDFFVVNKPIDYFINYKYDKAQVFFIIK